MKRFLIAFASLLCLSFFTNSFAQAKKAPYKAAYTSSFTIGKPAYSSIILNLWKDWDDNQLSRHDYFADTIKMWLPDGTVNQGKASVIEGGNKFRSGMSKVTSTIHAWVPLHSTDKGDDMVCIWGTEEDTYPDGKVDKRELHEVWWFNKAGKISMMRQWNAKFGE